MGLTFSELMDMPMDEFVMVRDIVIKIGKERDAKMRGIKNHG